MKIEIDNQSGKTVNTMFTGDSLVLGGANETDLSIATDTTGEYDLTSVSAGRIYFSFGGAFGSTAPDGANPSDPDYYHRFDKVEITFGANGGKANLTSVDFFGIPFSIKTYIADGASEIPIQQFNLASGKTANDLTSAIETTGNSTDAMQVKTKDGTSTVRWLSPVKKPDAYTSLQSYVDAIKASTTTNTIKGTYYGASAASYDYSAVASGDYLKLTMTGKSDIQIPFATLADAIYTCDGAYYLAGDLTTEHHVSENDFYAAVYRDAVAAMNLGYYDGTLGTDSDAWWGSATPYAGANGSGKYNPYAATILSGYPGAYGFPFSDRQRQVLLNLGSPSSSVPTSKLKITILADDATPTIETIDAISNPQSGIAKFNMVPVFGTPIQDKVFKFGGNEYKAGWANFVGDSSKDTNINNPTSAQINDIPAQEGWNKYDLSFGTASYQVLAKVVTDKGNSSITKAVITGGASSTWTSPNLFTGSLDTSGSINSQ